MMVYAAFATEKQALVSDPSSLLIAPWGDFSQWN
jgi:hypothetical protein